jgi:FkbM family methyltransferase
MVRGQSLSSVLLCMTPLQYLPVRVRRGLAAGARWTFLPYSYNWRWGGESDIVTAVGMLGDIRGASCWDMGAHFGIHTVGLAMQVGPEGQVAAFEPDPVAFRRLTRHVRMNHLANVRLFNAGVSDQVARADLIVTDGMGSVKSHFLGESETVDADTRRIQVDTICADLLVERGELRMPDFVKVDIQGHAARALAGSIVSIEKKRPLILFSSHNRSEADGTGRLLDPLGYRPLDRKGSRIDWESLDWSGSQTAILRAGRT